MNTSSSSHVPFVPACLSNPPGQYNPDIELLSIGIWIVEMVQPSLWGLSPQKLYTLVDDDYQFLRDEQGQTRTFDSPARAEAKIRELLAPSLNAMATAHAEMYPDPEATEKRAVVRREEVEA